MDETIWEQDCQECGLHEIALDIREKEEFEKRWGIVNFKNPTYRSEIFRKARQEVVPDYDDRQKHKENKQHHMGLVEAVFPREKSADQLVSDGATLDMRLGGLLLLLGEDLCTEKSLYADPAHFSHWRSLVVRIRDVYNLDHDRVHPDFNWDGLTAWYLLSQDIYLRANPKKKAQSSPKDEEEEEESS